MKGAKILISTPRPMKVDVFVLVTRADPSMKMPEVERHKGRVHPPLPQKEGGGEEDEERGERDESSCWPGRSHPDNQAAEGLSQFTKGLNAIPWRTSQFRGTGSCRRRTFGCACIPQSPSLLPLHPRGRELSATFVSWVGQPTTLPHKSVLECTLPLKCFEPPHKSAFECTLPLKCFKLHYTNLPSAYHYSNLPRPTRSNKLQLKVKVCAWRKSSAWRRSSARKCP